MAKIGDVGLAKTVISDYFSWETAAGTCESPHLTWVPAQACVRQSAFRSVRQCWQAVLSFNETGTSSLLSAPL